MAKGTEISPDEVIIYLRKSRSDDPSLTVAEVLEKHERILDEWSLKNLGGPVPEENRYREVVSGETIDSRPKIKEVLGRIESSTIKAVLAVETERLSRGDLEDAGRLIKLFRYTKTMVITPYRAYDLEDEYDRDFFERELKRGSEYLEYSKRIMNRGRLLSVQQGNYIGSVAPYGYEKAFVTDGKRKYPTLRIKEDEADVVRMIFDMYANHGMGRAKICRRLDEIGIKPPRGEHWSPSYLKDMLENVTYLGKVKWNRRKAVTAVENGIFIRTRPRSKDGEYLIFSGKHEPIISEALFLAAGEKCGKCPRSKSKAEMQNAFAGLLHCRCGRAMSLRTYKNGETVRSSPRLVCDDQAHCGTSSVLYEEMLSYVCDALSSSTEDFEVRTVPHGGDFSDLHGRLCHHMRERLNELEKKEASIWEKYAEEKMPKQIFNELNEKLIKEREEVKNRLLEIGGTLSKNAESEEKVYRFSDALEAVRASNGKAEEKNSLLSACIDSILYKREKAVRVKKGDAEAALDVVNEKGWCSPPFEVDVLLRF